MGFYFYFVKYYGVEGFGLGIKIHWLHIQCINNNEEFKLFPSIQIN